MSIEKINFSYPKRTLQSVFDHEEMTALELASKTSKKVDECVELVNGVEQSAIQATAIVDEMRITQEQFIATSSDAQAEILVNNQELLDELELSNATFQTAVTNSKTAFETSMNETLDTFETSMNETLDAFETATNNSKTLFETNMTTAVQTIIENANETIEEDVATKITTLINDGTVENLIEAGILTTIKDDIVKTELNFSDITGYGVMNGLVVSQQGVPNMSVAISAGTAHIFNGKRYVQTVSQNLTIDPAHNLYPRKDIIYIDSNNALVYGKGEAISSPVAPAPVNGLILAELLIPQSSTAITTSMITDKRIIKKTVANLQTEINTTTNHMLELAQITADDPHGTYTEFSQRNVNVKWYGALGNGVADDTTAIQSALNSGAKTVFFPAGTYKTNTLNLPAGVSIVGAGIDATFLKAIHATNDMITMDGKGSTICNLSMQAEANFKTGGSAIRINTQNWYDYRIQDVRFMALWDGIKIGDGTINPNIIMLKSLHFYDMYNSCIIMVSGSNLIASDIIAHNDTGGKTTYGFLWTGGDSVFMSQVLFVACRYGIRITPASGKVTQYGWFNTCTADTCSDIGMTLNAGSGTLRNMEFVNCWSSFNESYGVYLNGVNSVKFIGLRSLLNKLDGLFMAGSTDIDIQDSNFAGNDSYGTATYNGIYVAPSCSYFSIQNCRSRAHMGLASVQKWGLLIDTGGADNYIVTGNTFKGNVQGSMYDGGTGVNKIVANNLV